MSRKKRRNRENQMHEHWPNTLTNSSACNTPASSAYSNSSHWPMKQRSPVLTYSPLAWLKLNWFCQRQQNEIGGFGITKKDDLLYVEHFVTVKQDVSWSTTKFHPNSVADHFDDCADAGIPPAQCGRIWIHTHPGSSVSPSGDDEDTFKVSFSECNFAVMAILGRGGETYARLKIAMPQISMEIPVVVDWGAFKVDKLPDVAQWAEEYEKNIVKPVTAYTGNCSQRHWGTYPGYSPHYLNSHAPLYNATPDYVRHNALRTPLPYEKKDLFGDGKVEGYGPASEQTEEDKQVVVWHDGKRYDVWGEPLDPEAVEQEEVDKTLLEEAWDDTEELYPVRTAAGETVYLTASEIDQMSEEKAVVLEGLEADIADAEAAIEMAENNEDWARAIDHWENLVEAQRKGKA